MDKEITRSGVEGSITFWRSSKTVAHSWDLRDKNRTNNEVNKELNEYELLDFIDKMK